MSPVIDPQHFLAQHERDALLEFPVGFGSTTHRTLVSIRQLLQSKRTQILQIAARHGARKVRVFGSVACGTVRRNSDIDFLVDMEEGRSLLDHAALTLDLERLLKRSVDVASERGLRRPVRKEVLKEVVAL
jgi:predicted nucleotidyltransferase